MSQFMTRPRKTLDELAAEQGLTEPRPIDDLIGAGRDLWDSDEEFERFLASIQRHRPEGADAAGRSAGAEGGDAREAG